MRGVIRKAIKIKHFDWYVILGLSLILLLFYVTFALPNVEAVSRAEINEMKQELKNAHVSIDDKNLKVDQQNEKIKDQQKIIEDLKNELRETRKESTGTWDELTAIRTIQSQIDKSVQELSKLREQLIEFFKERSDLIKLAKDLDFAIDNSKIDSPPDLSHLAKKIGINLADVCITALQNNVTNPCGITYKNLIILDSSDTNISGKFTTDDNGYFHRANPILQKSWRVYDYDDKIRIFVDPPAGMSSRIKTIEITPNFDTYTLSGNHEQFEEFELITGNKTITQGNNTKVIYFDYLNKTQDYGRIVFHDRYIDEGCTKAKINANKIKELLADTINLMRNNCDDKFTSYITKEVIPIEKSYQDITTSQKWIDEQRLEYIKEHCIYKYKAC